MTTPRRLPYRATTATGNRFEFAFPLHPETGSAVQVANLLDLVLAVLDREIGQVGPVNNGDVLQALAMALAVRTRILPGNPDELAGLTASLVEQALRAPVRADPNNLPPGEPREIH